MKNFVLKKYVIYFILIVLIIVCLFFHPLIHIKYWYQSITNTGTNYFSIADGYYRNSKDDYIPYESSSYFSKSIESDMLSFDASSFDNERINLCFSIFL